VFSYIHNVRPSSGELDVECSIWFSAPSFWMGSGLESRCAGRVYGADGATHLMLLMMGACTRNMSS